MKNHTTFKQHLLNQEQHENREAASSNTPPPTTKCGLHRKNCTNKRKIDVQRSPWVSRHTHAPYRARPAPSSAGPWLPQPVPRPDDGVDLAALPRYGQGRDQSSISRRRSASRLSCLAPPPPGLSEQRSS